MTKIVGIDFGTANVRIAHWDVDSGENPVSAPIGDGVLWMPSVIAFQKQADGEINVEVGESADSLWGVPNTEVIRNIKRWTLASDPYVHDVIEWTFQKQENPWPEWFDRNTRSIRLWDETVMTAEEAITRILKEAIIRAKLVGADAEWRVGCPVESDLIYRKALVSALAELGCEGQVKWGTEEPLLLLALGIETGELQDGRYIVYDLGGGSFDCAVVEVRDKALIILAEEGLLLGGADIDDMLVDNLRKDGYTGSPHLVRIAKEQLTDQNPVVDIDGYELTLDDVKDAIEKGDFINKTMSAMVNAYHKARILFSETQMVGGWRSTIEQMVKDIDGVLLVGGPTRMDYFAEELSKSKFFGDKMKIITTSKLVQEAGRADIVDPELTALSHGANYLYGDAYAPLTVDRIPFNITLEVTDGHLTAEDTYTAFQRLPFERQFAPYEGHWIAMDTEENNTYSVLITDPDGNLLHKSGPHNTRMPRDGYLGPLADRVRLVVDRLGGITVKLGAGLINVPSPLEDEHEVLLTTLSPSVMQSVRTTDGGMVIPPQTITTLETELLATGRGNLTSNHAARSVSGGSGLESYDTSLIAARGEKGQR